MKRVRGGSAGGALMATAALVALVAACGAGGSEERGGGVPATASAPVVPANQGFSVSEIERAVRQRAQQVLAALRERDMEELAAFVHPISGVRLSPHGFVDMERDVVLSAAGLVAEWGGGERLWGYEDGTGEPLEMSFAEYFGRFVYDEDYATATETSIDRALGRGNTINNAAEAYPSAVLVERHFPGFEPEHDGMDWKSLRLAFELHDGEWYLVGIIHDQWTI